MTVSETLYQILLISKSNKWYDVHSSYLNDILFWSFLKICRLLHPVMQRSDSQLPKILKNIVDSGRGSGSEAPNINVK